MSVTTKEALYEMRLTSTKKPDNKSCIAHPAEILGAEVELGHKSDALRHITEGAFPVLRYGEKVHRHGSPFEYIEGSSAYIETLLRS